MMSSIRSVTEKFFLARNGAEEIDYKVVNDRYRTLKRELGLQYAVYSVPISPFDIITLGRCVFYEPKGSWNTRGEFKSREYVDPIFLDAFAELENQIHYTGDRHHIYLEWVSLEKIEDGVKFLSLDVGS